MENKKLRIFAGEFQEGNIKPLYSPDSKNFENGDCVVVMHREDYLWLINRVKKSKGND